MPVSHTLGMIEKKYKFHPSELSYLHGNGKTLAEHRAKLRWGNAQITAQ